MESAMALSLCQLGTLIVRQQSYAALDCDAHLVQDHMKPQQIWILALSRTTSNKCSSLASSPSTLV